MRRASHFGDVELDVAEMVKSGVKWSGCLSRWDLI
jgi:hypothetical protein